jgi:uncharacterized protein (TIGR01777 family)
VAGLERAQPRPSVLVSASAAGYYGDRGDVTLEEDATPGTDFLADLCVQWEAAADGAVSLGLRVARVRTGIVLDRSGGALKRMLPAFRLGVGGPLGSGRQYMPWIALDDLVGVYVAAVEGDERWSGAFNACGPRPATNREFARTLGRVLHRPAVMPVPPIALRIVLGELAGSVTSSQRMVPTRALAAGYQFQYPELEAADAAAARLSPSGRRARRPIRAMRPQPPGALSWISGLPSRRGPWRSPPSVRPRRPCAAATSRAPFA